MPQSLTRSGLSLPSVSMPSDDATIQLPQGCIARRPPALRKSLTLQVPPPGAVASLRDASLCELRGIDGSALDVYLLGFDVHSFVPEAFSLAGIARPSSVARSVQKRQAEFLFGRLAARLALSRQLAADADSEVTIGPTREPVWPADAIGSISHCNDLAAATAERRGVRSGIGIDVERIATGDAFKALLATVVNEPEIALLQQQANDEWRMQTLLTLLFSAKESFFKGAFGVVGKYFDFSAAQLVSVDREHRRIRFSLTETLCAQFQMGQLVDTGFDFLESDLVLTHFVW